jgi:hypothetical protein
MVFIAFILNLPYTIIGLVLALLSLPRSIDVHTKPFALIIHVRSFWWLDWVPSHKGVRATTAGNVALSGPKLLKNDLEHELIHIEQSNREPLIHPFLYFWESFRHGYRKNKYEVEAYEKAGNVYLEK